MYCEWIRTRRDGGDEPARAIALAFEDREDVERLNQEVRRRERVIRIFPNEESALRLIGAVLMETDEAWSTGHRYFDLEEYWRWRASLAAPDGSTMKNEAKHAA